MARKLRTVPAFLTSRGLRMIGVAIAVTACAQTPLEPDVRDKLRLSLSEDPDLPWCSEVDDPQPGENCIPDEDPPPDGGTNYDPLANNYYYGSYTHLGAQSTDADVDNNQSIAYNYDNTAFNEDSRDWANPDAYGVSDWPAAVAAGQAAIGAGRALARTSHIRQAVINGLRWARDVTAGIAAGLLAASWPRFTANPEDVPVEEFDFMFDYSNR
jgi:hypothetical protein